MYSVCIVIVCVCICISIYLANYLSTQLYLTLFTGPIGCALPHLLQLRGLGTIPSNIRYVGAQEHCHVH